jgi:hypothetical protein
MITIGELSIGVSMAGLVPYVKQIIWGNVRPERATWFIWTIIMLMSLLGFDAAGGGDGWWFILGDFLVTFVIFIFSLFRGVGGWSKLDIICLIVATFGLILWQVSNQPLLVLIGVIVADVMGVIPTLKKALEQPESESASTFLFTTVAAAMGFVAVGNWNWTLLSYPLYLFLANGIVAQVILVSQYQMRRLRDEKANLKQQKAVITLQKLNIFKKCFVRYRHMRNVIIKI